MFTEDKLEGTFPIAEIAFRMILTTMITNYTAVRFYSQLKHVEK